MSLFPAFKCFALVFVCILAYLLYQMTYPPKCKRKLKYCYTPLWENSEVKVDIDFHVNGRSIWSYTRHPISLALESNISIPLNQVTISQSQVYGFLSFTAVSDGSSGSLRTENTVVYKIRLAEQRKIRGRAVARNLLNAASNFSAPESSDTEFYGYRDKDNTALFWKFLWIPLEMRYMPVYQTIEVGTFENLFQHRMVARRRTNTNTGLGLANNMYEPLMWVDDMSILQRHHTPIRRAKQHDNNSDISGTSTANASSSSSVNGARENSTIPSVNMPFRFTPSSTVYFGVKKVVEKNMNLMSSLVGEDELDEIKMWMSEDRLFRLMMTQLIAWVHLILEYLAFQDDWRFFKGRKTFSGLSPSSMFFSVGRGVVMFLYLLDEDASWIILGTMLKDIVYGCWKLCRVLRPKVTRSISLGIVHIPLAVQFRDLSKECSAEERKTVELDNAALQKAGIVIYPLIVALAVYNLQHYSYRSWYSWVISSLADSVYVFGFLSMIPQLYINHKMRSVAHLPVRAFMYKIFNTFIDDIFAFLVKMPFKHRIMTLRDDVIFLGFLYQWWIFPVNKNRVNEFGFQYEGEGGEGEDEGLKREGQGKGTDGSNDVTVDCNDGTDGARNTNCDGSDGEEIEITEQ